ncbi:glucarate dehydratase [Peribacillus frigoritolerans]|uniref:glucarate dehydratase family protein n=1 Tax=Peribacillus frigoritolerans TaxID=450367 RepID=UPI00209E6E74|nr:glucarate dehydratase family protein [Peribacillus frigoritolerans]MCP1493524.1 glucarate dehydratase [Peribacillus frigoritolerans]
MKSQGSPIITDMKVIPVAGYDSALLTLSGCHAPYFTRNIVILEDETGNTGIGEIHGGDDITRMIESYRPFVIGQEIADYRSCITAIRKGGMSIKGDSGEGLQGLNLANLKFVVQAEAAVECAMMDLLGKFVNKPIAALLGDGGIQRTEVPFLGYLFYIADMEKLDLNYIRETQFKDDWDRVRRIETLTAEGIVAQAKAAEDRYGFKSFKLKGGVLRGEEEMEAIQALHEAFPDSRINLDPNGAWSLEEAIKLCKGKGDILAYIEDPCGPEAGFSSREIMAEFKIVTGLPVATNMIATNWRQFHHSAVLRAVDIVLADPHFWTLNGSIRMAHLLNDWGLTWGSHSNNHFDITLAAFTQVAAAAPGNISPIDTHYIWQDGQELCDDPLQIIDGMIKLPDKPGLGVEINMDKVMKANELYRSLPYHDRDDSTSMQYLIKEWKYNSKKPCMVR